MGPGGFFPTNPDLADILGRTDLNFENFYFFHFWTPTFLDFQIQKSGFPDFQKSGFPGFQKIWISRLPKNPHGGRGAGGRADLENLEIWGPGNPEIWGPTNGKK